MPPSANAALPSPRRVKRGIKKKLEEEEEGGGGSSSGSHLPKRQISHKFRAQDFVRKRQNESLSDYYALGKLLGEGQFGEVFVGTVCLKNNNNNGNGSTNGQRGSFVSSAGGSDSYRAIKRIAKDLLTEADHDEVFNEFFVLKQMDHPNICKMYEFFEDPDDFWFVQELCSGGELLDELERIETFTEATAGLIMKQVLSSVHYCHSQKQVVHRDLKLENILLEGETTSSTTITNNDYNPMIVKVIDFGLATTFQEDQILTSPVGSMHYIAPEVLEQEYRGGTCDIWSCGVIAYILLCGWAPFDAANDRDMRELIMMGHVSFDDPIWHNEVSAEARDFVSYLLTYEPDQRPDAAAALQHPWIQNASRAHLQHFKATKSGTDAATKFLSNCRQFEATSKLKQATCAFMTSQLVLSSSSSSSSSSGGRPEEGGEGGDDESSAASDNNTSNSATTMIGEIFRAIDVDYDGRLSREEFRMGFQDFFGDQSPSLEEVDDIFDRIDLSSTGYIDYSEFVIACMGLHNQDQPHHQQLLQQAFDRLLDKDGSGFISHDKLRNEMAPFYGEDVEEDIIQKIIDQADADKDGQISWGDFQAMMCKTADFVPPENPTPLMKRQKSRSTDHPAPALAENVVKNHSKSESDTDSDETQATKASTVEPEPDAATKDTPKTTAPAAAAAATTTIIPGLRKRSSVGPRARLISAMYEKNLEKNRQMGVDGFAYIRKQPERSGPKRRLPRTRRVDFEELMKKPTAQIDFDIRKQRAGRRNEIEHFKTTTGKARERRATIMTMFAQEKTDDKGRDERLQEIETLNIENNTKDRCESIPHIRNSFAREVEEQKRERQREELSRVKKSLKDGGSLSRKELFESWDEANVRASIAEKRASRIVKMYEELKNFHDMVPEEEDLVEKSVEVANRRASVPMNFKVREPRRSRRWTRHMSGKSMTRESIKNNKAGSSKPARRMGRSASQADLMVEEEQEDRLIGMQPHGETKRSAHLIEPLRRLNSFDSQQEHDCRHKRLDEMLAEMELPPLEVTLTEQDPQLQSEEIDHGQGSNSAVDMVAAQREARFNELHSAKAKAGAKSLRARRNSTVEMAAAQRKARLGELKGVESGKAKNTRGNFEGSTQGDQPASTVVPRAKLKKSKTTGEDLPPTIVPKAKLKKSKTSGEEQPTTLVPKVKLRKAKTSGGDQPSTVVPTAKLKKSGTVGEDRPSRKVSKVKKKKRNTIGACPSAPKSDQVQGDSSAGREEVVVKRANVVSDGDMKVDNLPSEERELIEKANVEPDGESNDNSMVELNAPCLDSSFDGSIDLSAVQPIPEEVPDISSPSVVKPRLHFERSAPELRHSPVREYYEKPSPRDPEKDKRIRTPKNVPRMAPKTPPNTRGKVKNRLSLKPRVGGPPLGGGRTSRRASATATMKSTEAVLTDAQAQFLQMAKERALESKGLSSNTPAPAKQAA